MSVQKAAKFSEDRIYRYSLHRGWDNWEVGRTLMVIGLNPSTADENEDDPTIRRCIAFAKQWGMQNLIMTNLFAFRSTDPKGLLSVEDPIGKENDKELLYWGQERADLILVAWGAHSTVDKRAEEVLKLIRGPFCLGYTKKGHPRHPLYVPSKTEPIPFIPGGIK